MGTQTTPHVTRDTPHGRLYAPAGHGWQILALVAAFAGSVLVGDLVGRVPGDLGEAARTVLHVPYLAVFLVGYASWSARVAALGASLLGRSVVAVLAAWLLRRKPAGGVADVLADEDRLTEFAVRAQRAGASFSFVAWPIGLLAGAGALAFDTSMGMLARAGLVAGTVVGWGYVLAALGRRGWLPVLEPE